MSDIIKCTVRIAEERQDLIDHKITLVISNDQTGKIIKGRPLQLAKRHRLLLVLSANNVQRLSYLAAVEYMENLRAQRTGRSRQ